jgi:hypothetical protein
LSRPHRTDGDGGLQYSGDIAKALVAGADTVIVRPDPQEVLV